MCLTPQASGVAVSDECLKVYEEVKMGHKWLYIIYRISDDLSKIVVEEKGGHGQYTQGGGREGGHG